jgi:hypothetical protein
VSGANKARSKRKEKAMFQSFIYETVNCSTIESCQAMEIVHAIMDEVCESETTKSLRSAGFVTVEISDEIEFTVF